MLIYICCTCNHSFTLRSFQIKVRLPNDRIVTGWIEDPKIYVDFFIVNIKNVSGVDAASLDRDMQFEPHTKVVAVWRCFNSGLLKSTRGLNLASPTSEKIVSTCRIHKVSCFCTVSAIMNCMHFLCVTSLSLLC